MGAIGPYEFQGKSVWTNPLVSCFQGESVWTNGPASLPKVSTETGIGPWMALPYESCMETLVSAKQASRCLLLADEALELPEACMFVVRSRSGFAVKDGFPQAAA